VMGMMHHGLMEHYAGQKTLFSDYVLDGYTNVASLFASYGMKAVFTGHYHAQDIVKGTFGGKDIYDIETGSTVTYPCPYRIMDLQPSGQLVINTHRITAIDYNLGGAPDFQTYAYNYLHTGMLQLSSWMLQAAPYGLSEPMANYLAPAVTEAMEDHYIGDEPGLGGASPATFGVVTNLLAGDAQSRMLGGAIWSLLTDLTPSDNSYTLNLSGVTLVSPADGELYTEGQTIVLEAAANWDVTNVDFVVDGVLVGSTATRPYTFSGIAPTGTHTIVAVALDNLGQASTSSVVTVTVRPAGPVVDIKVNGSDGPVNVTTSQTVSATIHLNVGRYGGRTVEWYVLAHDVTRDVWYQYVAPFTTTSWRAPWTGGTSLQAPLSNVGPYEVLRLNGMAAGQYDFFFGIDMNRNGWIDVETLYYDSVSVTVAP
ncbi:MAG: Ig-like domain-containing protein, partial [bacterium]